MSEDILDKILDEQEPADYTPNMTEILLDEFMALRHFVEAKNNQDMFYWKENPKSWLIILDDMWIIAPTFLNKYKPALRELVRDNKWRDGWEPYVNVYFDIQSAPLSTFDRINEALGFPPIDRTDQIEAGEYE